MSEEEMIPEPGQWPVDPQEDVPIAEDSIWVDGCFDFAHHGHAGACLQARQLGNTLLVGVHSDEAILENKGPTVMTLNERIAAAEACRWVTRAIPHAPYVTSLPWVSHYGCKYVVHGDDITSDSDGNDCYRYVKAAGRFKVVKRTPGISTTDLVGRMLLCTRTHFIKSLEKVIAGEEGSGSIEERKERGTAMQQRIQDYATNETGLHPGPEVWSWRASRSAKEQQVADGGSSNAKEEQGQFAKLVAGICPKPNQRIVYVDGGWDLFSTGHSRFLEIVVKTETEVARQNGWFTEESKEKRIAESGSDYEPVFLVAGIHDDEVINYWKGVNYPIMNIFERGLCLLQCKYIHAVIFGAPFTLTKSFLNALPYGLPNVVAHGQTSFIPLDYDPYVVAKAMGVFKDVGEHDYQNVNAGEIVQRIMKSRAMYEERQRVKGVKGIGEEAARRREQMEREAEEITQKREAQKQAAS